MNKVLKLISDIVASVAMLAIGLFMYAIVAGFIIDEATHVEDDPLPNTVEISNTDIVAGEVKVLSIGAMTTGTSEQ